MLVNSRGFTAIVMVLFFNEIVFAIPYRNKNVQTVANSKLEFPQWLKDFTHLNDWPDMNPPYIPLSFIDFSKVPDLPKYNQNQCPGVSRLSCSFDCHKCLEHDDIITCDRLIQTFDDGPTPATLNLLDNLKNKVTFFNLGINIVKYPDIYRTIINRGHDTASHTWSHVHLPSLNNEQIVAQLEWTMWAMNATGNHIPRYFRPPFGGVDSRVRAIARQFGLQSVLWDHDTFDWQVLIGQRNEYDIYKDALKWHSKGDNGIILEHDTTYLTTNIGLQLEEILNNKQKTVAQCVGGTNYIRKL
ncbi:Chitin deacetylase 2 [Nakaseomyces bracarensis]|uniref:chitin deacetylase n=1 Tax=Nakaseomyces bracarensis TaxID=273131 RepID=A0ABR4NNC1_9SACH